MENYKRALQKIIDHKIDPNSVEEIKSRIIDRIESRTASTDRASLINFLFGWADIVWLRGSMVFASFALVMLFVGQQFTVINRLGSLEERMMGISTESVMEFQKENMHLNSVRYIENSNINPDDSVRVSNRDLGSLLRSYRDLQEKLRDIEETNGSMTTDKNRGKLKL